MAKARQILFRIFYSTTFTIIFIVLIAFICVSPADTLYESYKRGRNIDIFLIAGTYVVTGLIAILIYASRLFSNRSVLKDIPKTYMPIERDDLPTTRTWKFVSDMLVRSAVVAYQTKPRSKRIEHELPVASARITHLLNPESGKKPGNVGFEADWGTIHHPGWSSPAASDLPDLQYENVVAELTDLVEAKAVSLAPVDHVSIPAPDGAPVPNRRVIEALTRPDDAGMRKYISQLIELEVALNDELTNAFIVLYERSRFALEPLSSSEFQTLMRMFAELLRSMKQPNLDLIDMDTLSEEDEDQYEDEDESNLENDDDNNDNEDDDNNNNNDDQRIIYTTNLPTSAQSTFTISTIDSNSSVIHLPPPRISEDSAPSLATDEEASTTQAPQSCSRTNPRHETPTNRTTSRRFVSSHSRPHSLRQQPSSTSLATTKSDTSRRSGRSALSNDGSVIVRLNNDHSTMSESLPYTIEIVPRAVVVADT